MPRTLDPIWAHFERGSAGGRPQATCKFCGQVFKTCIPKRMRGHILDRCGKAPAEAKEELTVGGIPELAVIPVAELERLRKLEAMFDAARKIRA